MNTKNKNLSLWDKTNNLHKKYKLICFENLINLNRIVAWMAESKYTYF